MSIPDGLRFGWTFFAACIIDFFMIIAGIVNHCESFMWCGVGLVEASHK